MQFEAVEPAQRAFATLCYPLEHLVYVYALVAAHPQQGAVNKTDAGTFAQEAFLNENDKLHHHGFLQLCKPVVRNDLGKQVPVPDAYFIQVKVFQTFVIGAVEHYHDEYDFGLGQTAVTVIFALPVFSWDFKSSAAEHRVKNLAELVCHYKNFHNFVIGEHSDRSICLKLSTLNLILLSLTTKFSTIYFHRTHVKVIAVCMNALGKNPQENTDNVSILLKYENGTNAVINYFANGSKSYAKERVEVFSQEKVLVLDNWRRLEGFGVKGFSKMTGTMDKGHKRQFALLNERLQKGGEALIPFESIVNTTRASFACIESLKKKAWVEVR